METEQVDWHLKKEFSYGHIISTLILMGGMAVGWAEIQNRLVVLESHANTGAHYQAERRLDALEENMARVFAVDAAMAIRLEDLQDQIIRRLDRQDIKLDRIEDRLNQHDTNGRTDG